MTEIIYRKAIEADAGKITEFQLQMAHETEGLELDYSICSRGVKAVFEDPGKGIYFVAEYQGCVIASLLITYEWSDWKNQTVWWIQSVYVDQAARGKGVYKGLYSYIKDLAVANDEIRGIRLYVDRTNTPAQEVYRKLQMNDEHYSLFEWMK